MIPTVFPFLPEKKCISVSGCGPAAPGGSRREGGGAVSAAHLPGVIVPLLPSRHRTLTSRFGLPLSLFRYALGKVVFCLAMCAGDPG